MASVARALLALASVPTVLIMLVYAWPRGEVAPWDMIITLLLSPFLVAWALAPYFVANKFALALDDADGWWLVTAIPITAIPALWIYAQAVLVPPSPDGQAGALFAIVPIYQSMFILAVYGAIRGWRRFLG